MLIFKQKEGIINIPINNNRERGSIIFFGYLKSTILPLCMLRLNDYFIAIINKKLHKTISTNIYLKEVEFFFVHILPPCGT